MNVNKVLNSSETDEKVEKEKQKAGVNKENMLGIKQIQIKIQLNEQTYTYISRWMHGWLQRHHRYINRWREREISQVCKILFQLKEYKNT